MEKGCHGTQGEAPLGADVKYCENRAGTIQAKWRNLYGQVLAEYSGGLQQQLAPAYNPLTKSRIRMKRYRNLSGDSGVVAYEIRPAAIVVQFQGGEKYEYTELSAGAVVIAAMQQLARSGRGLSTFIAQHRPGYARTLP